ncbi:uncharacterized protein LOC123310940 [Coccinella septempunctata]|uniref:uncharacterized protein LOC123310940 n=1 Tax=Coccinella septempunctata TaxID=41139 RepID=UPI001D0708C8|nr:uncharacterized protein LOC123310940 [Coccinella septempunctata]
MASFAEIHQNGIIDNHNSNNSVFKENTHQTDIEQILKIEYSRYVRNKILYECLVDSADELDPEMAKKLECIINDIKLKQYLKLENQSLLGLTLKNEELTFQQGEELKSVLQKMLWERKCRITGEFKSITSIDLDQAVNAQKRTPSLHDLYLTQKDQSVISHKEKLVKAQESFMKNVVIRSQLLEEMLDLRLNKVPEMCHQTNRYCKAMIESNYLKAKIAEYKMKLDIFMEIPKAIEAYHQLLKDIKKQQEECELSIEKMKEMKGKYENVSGREYDEILKSYLMYKRSIDELNKMYELVK